MTDIEQIMTVVALIARKVGVTETELRDAIKVAESVISIQHAKAEGKAR